MCVFSFFFSDTKTKSYFYSFIKMYLYFNENVLRFSCYTIKDEDYSLGDAVFEIFVEIPLKIFKI